MSRLKRRQFLKAAGASAVVATVVPRHVLGAGEKAPSEKLNMAAVGCGGRAWSDIRSMGSENWVALCDVDHKRGGAAIKKYPDAKTFKDFRKMFDAMEDKIDAVMVGTPDHTHAVAAMAAIKRKKHVYCEKPLAHSLREVRALTEAARKYKVVTQLGNQGHSSSHIRLMCEWVWDGAIGDVTEVHAACGAFPQVYCQIDKLPQLKEKHDVPADLDWDLWQGPVKERPYSPLYVPWNWRGWQPYGTGALGDFGCHVLDPAFWALDLGSPKTVVAEADGWDPKKHADVFPRGTKITFEFAPRGKRKHPVKLVWFDGTRKLPKPEELDKGRKVPGTGAILIGSKGKIMHGSHGAGGCRIIPEAKMKEYKRPAESIPRVKDHHWDFLEAIRTGRNAGSNFDYGGPLTEVTLIGVIALNMLGRKLEWDGEKMKFTNCDEANKLVAPPFREGWTL